MALNIFPEKLQKLYPDLASAYAAVSSEYTDNNGAGVNSQLRDAGFHLKSMCLDIQKVYQLGSLFQRRNMHDRHVSSKEHVKTLCSIIDDNRNHSTGRLDRIVVWNSGLRWYLIEGHHRARAFQRKKWQRTQMDFTVFTGTLEEALLFSTRSNSKVKLNMTKAERTAAAWDLTLHTELLSFDPAQSKHKCKWRTKAKLFALSCGVSQSTVDTMRSVYRLHLELSHKKNRSCAEEEALRLLCCEAYWNSSFDDPVPLDDGDYSIEACWDGLPFRYRLALGVLKGEQDGEGSRPAFDHEAAERKKNLEVERLSKELSGPLNSHFPRRLDYFVDALELANPDCLSGLRDLLNERFEDLPEDY